MPAKSAAQKRFMDAAAHNPAFAKKAGIPVSVATDFSEASKGMKFGKGARSRPDRQDINKPKTNHGDSAFFAKGGAMKESKAMEMRHVAAMKKAGVSKKVIAEEKAEADAMKKGGSTKKLAFGGGTGRDRAAEMSGRTMPSGGRPSSTGLSRAAEMSGRTMPTTGRPAMKKGGKVKKMAVGGPSGIPVSTGLARAAEMSGRTMPTGGAPAVMPTVGTAAPVRPDMPVLPAAAAGRVPMKKGGKTASCYAKGGVTRGDGIASKGKTKGKMV